MVGFSAAPGIPELPQDVVTAGESGLSGEFFLKKCVSFSCCFTS